MSSFENLKLRLIECIKETNSLHIIKPGEKCFKLSHGGLSPYYVDLRKTVLSKPECLRIVGELVKYKLNCVSFDTIVGKGYGAYPLCIITAQLLNKPVVIIRDKPKEHGLRGWFVGDVNLISGRKVVILDDVITTGLTIIETAKLVEEVGGEIVKIIVVLDRLEGGVNFVKEKGYDIECILTRVDLGLTDDLIQSLIRFCSEN